MDLTVASKPTATHKKTRSDSIPYKPGCFTKIDCSNITFNIKNPLSCLGSKLDPAPLTPRRSILELSEVKRIAEQSAGKSKLKRVKSKLVATINLNTKQTHCVDSETRREQSRRGQKLIRRTISISDSLMDYQKITPVQSTPKSSFNILKQITPKESNISQFSESSGVRHKVIRASANYQDGPKRCIKIVAASKRQEEREKGSDGMYYTFSPYADENGGRERS